MDQNGGVWFVENLNWIVPMCITIIFSILNIRMARVNAKTAQLQLKLQNDAFCFQLFERRMAVYTAMQTVLSKVATDDAVSEEALGDFLQSTRDAKFLFGDDVVKKRDDLYSAMVDLQEVGKEIKSNTNKPGVSKGHEELCNRDVALMTQIQEAILELEEVFAPYISFKGYLLESGKVKK